MKLLSLTIFFSLVLAGCASIHESPSTVTDKEIDFYKFGIDRGCRDACARKGDSQAKIDSFCGCMQNIFNRNLSKMEWQQAVFYSQKRRDREETQVMAPYMPLIESCRSSPELNVPPPTVQLMQTPSIIGNWEWTRKTNNCTEVYSFRADGSAFIVSGEEKTENTYVLSEALQSSGRYKLTLTTTKDYGGRDCSDSPEEDSRGKASDVYLLFSPDGNMLAMCESELGMACFGPLKRSAK